MTTSKPVLEVTNLSARYGKVGALAGATLTVPAGSIVTVIGANGAGKSTMLNAMMGALPQTGHAAGSVQYAGTDVSSWPVERRVAAGMSLVPERRELFGSMSVEDNLLLAVSAATAPAKAAGATRSTKSSTCSRACVNAAPSRPARCLAASARCWRSAAR